MEKPLRIASYNIRKGIGLDRQRRPERNLAVMAELGADIIAVQEADRRLGNRPAALTPAMIREGSDFSPVLANENGVSLGWHGNAVLISDRFTVTGIDRLDLPSFEPRGALIVDLDGPQPLTIVATHLGLMRRHRRLQFRAILDRLAERDDRPTIILGDFNEWAPISCLSKMNGGFTVHSPGKSFHASRPIAGLDRIAVNGNLELLDAGVSEQGAARIASDHLPIWGDFGVVDPKP
ncbi:endonuclease/exonuclease/phosphatase family protein [Pseudoruegeria sp. SK021]|uniref:endonuclease/exonuclease/phosphatase family protein n=1 Tax=Pseudoruegeria sp. SK021 TaxID=1933035 RepID=UPI000A251179|nr:endonuclease/exonuclease/phosphatase family protein [Pseudoruegeria sp. SK021]OSP54054.1 hypothetical protein BV911_14660 [Pseudoruegeria sp. SK021]